MAEQSREQIKAWFLRGLYPTQEQFHGLLDSFLHKNEDKITISSVIGLSEQLNSKYTIASGKVLESMVDQLRKDVEVYQLASSAEFTAMRGHVASLKTEDARLNAAIERASIAIEAETARATIAEGALRDADMAIRGDIATLQGVDASLRQSVTAVQGDITLVRDMLKSGATLAAAKTAMVGLGANYKDLYSVASTLKAFLDAKDTADTTINTWTEIEAFLAGITDTQSLTGLLNSLEAKITAAYNVAIAAAVKVETDRAKAEEVRIAGLVASETTRAKAAEAALTSTTDTLSQRQTNLNTNINNEIDRATAAEKVTSDGLASEITRSKAEEVRIVGLVSSETTRAKGEETKLFNSISAETSRATTAEAALRDADAAIRGDIATLQGVDASLRQSVTAVQGDITLVRDMIKSGASLSAAKTAMVGLGANYKDLYSVASTLKAFLDAKNTVDTTIDTWAEIEAFLAGITDTASLTGLLNALEVKITAAYNVAIAAAVKIETDRAKAAEATLTATTDTLSQRQTNLNTNINNEIDRATAAEKVTSDGLASEITRSKAEEVRIVGLVSSETTRAKGEETKLFNSISAETSRATTAEGALRDADMAIRGDIATLQGVDASLRQSVTAVQGDITLVRDMLKSGATLAAAKTAMVGLGANYKDLYSVASTLKTFLDAKDTADTTINTWTEIEAFLAGITDTASLTGLLNALESRITTAYQNEVADVVRSDPKFSGDINQVTHTSFCGKGLGSTGLYFPNAPFISFGGDGRVAQFNASGGSLFFRAHTSFGSMGYWEQVHTTGTLKIATSGISGIMSYVDKAKLDGIAAGANNYVHPAGEHLTAAERTAWNSKETVSGAQTKANTALNSAKSYTDTHMTDKSCHVTAAEREAWNSKATGVLATTTVAGLMSPSDKKKLSLDYTLNMGAVEGEYWYDVNGNRKQVYYAFGAGTTSSSAGVGVLLLNGITAVNTVWGWVMGKDGSYREPGNGWYLMGRSDAKAVLIVSDVNLVACKFRVGYKYIE